MNEKLRREFLFVYSNDGDRRMPEHVVEDFQLLNIHAHCRVSVYDDTITISCGGLSGFGALADACTRLDREGPVLLFCSTVRAAMVKFIG